MLRATSLTVLLTVAGSPEGRAQDIFLLDLTRDGESYTFDNARNVTERPGYDNQPFFTPDSQSFLYVSQRGSYGDVYEYDVRTGATRQVTDTPDVPEYSPMPNENNTAFTVVRENTTPDQTVWRVDRATGESTWALNSREPIGYYRFNPRGEALVWVRYAFTVQLSRPDESAMTFVSGHAAPSTPKLVPGTNKFTFVHRQVNGESWIKELDPADLSVRPVAPLLGEQIYYAWTNEGTLLTGKGSTLHHWVPESSSEWSEIADLAELGVRDITRLRVSPDSTKIAIVAADSEP